MLLERLEMENFKSFRGRHEVAFGPGLNCITGANGSGKSNILEAICFAFGESSCARLRVANMKELHSTHRKGVGGTSSAQETTTRVTLHLRTRQNEPMVLCATLCASTSHRTYKLNNRTTPMKLVKRHLRLQCGINVDISLWLIQQNFVHKMPSRTPVELASYLCEAGGTKLFFEYREEAQAAMETFKHSVQTIQQNIQHLTEVVRRESSIVHAHQKHSKNDREIKVLEAKCKHLNEQLLFTTLKSEKEQLHILEVEENKAVSSLESSKSAFTCLQETASDLQQRLIDVKHVQHEHEAIQLELVRIRTEQEEAAARMDGLQKDNELNSQKQISWHQELTGLADRMKENQSALCQSNARIASMQSIIQLASMANSQGTSPSSLVEEIARRIQQLEQENSTQTAAQLQMKLIELRAHQTQMESTRDKAMQDAALTRTEVTEANKNAERLRVKTRGWTDGRVEKESNDLQARLEACDEELRGIVVDLPKCHVPVQGEGDYGLLMDHLTMKNSIGIQSPWIGALGILLGKSLANRICSDKQMAKRILAANGKRYAFTIWPVRDLKLQPRKLDRHLRDICEAYGSENVVDPLDLISVSRTITPELAAFIVLCLRKAAGSWLLVKTDDIGRDVLNKYGIPSVSTNLNMHSPGLLSGGYRRSDTAFLAFTKLRSVQARQAELESALASLAGIRSDIECFSSLQRKLTVLEAKQRHHESDIEGAKRDIRHLQHQRQSLEQQQSAFLDAGVRKRVFEADLKAYQSAVHENSKVVDPVRTIYAGRDMAVVQDEARRLHEVHTELEIACSSLQTRIDQLGDEITQNEDQLSQLKVSTESLNDAEATFKSQEISSTQKLQQCAEYTMQHKSTLASIHRTSEQMRRLEAALEKVVNRKRTVQEKIGYLEREIDCDAYKDLDSKSRMASMTMEELQERLHDLEKQRGSLALEQKVLQAQLSPTPHLIEDTVSFKQRQLARFQDQHQSLRIAIQNLEDGIRSTQERSAHANNMAFGRVQRCLQRIFSRVVPSKRVELRKLGESIEMGVTFGVSGRSDPNDSHTEKTTKELSGGQLAMLGMAYVFALARFSASPLYILDEIDAALDEHNQRVVADLVLEHFNHSQVICISHHDAFHARASQIIEVQKLETTSKIATRKQRR